MNEPWELPDNIQKAEELAKRDDEGYKINVSKTWRWNWDDTLAKIATNLFGWIWRGK